MTQEFMGYRRPDGRVGVRNRVAVLSAMDNTNPCASRIGAIVEGTTVLSTPFGRTQIGHDSIVGANMWRPKLGARTPSTITKASTAVALTFT